MLERGWKFWTRVDKTGECWIWTGGVNRYGYGKATWGATTRTTAHRVAWRLTFGEFPNGPLDHLCRNRLCVRPTHLEQVTNAENVRRGLHGVLRTHCKRGHPMTPDNLVPWAPKGAKWCHPCQKDWHAANRIRIREEAA